MASTDRETSPENIISGGCAPPLLSDRKYYSPIVAFIAGHKLINIDGDGDCFFSSLNYGRSSRTTTNGPKVVARGDIVRHMRTNVHEYGFKGNLNFGLRGNLTSFPTNAAKALKLLTPQSHLSALEDSFNDVYCDAMLITAQTSVRKHGTWASDREILAAADLIYTANQQVILTLPVEQCDPAQRVGPALFVHKRQFHGSLGCIGQATSSNGTRYFTYCSDRTKHVPLECIVLQQTYGHFDRVLHSQGMLTVPARRCFILHEAYNFLYEMFLPFPWCVVLDSLHCLIRTPVCGSR